MHGGLSFLCLWCCWQVGIHAHQVLSERVKQVCAVTWKAAVALTKAVEVVMD